MCEKVSYLEANAPSFSGFRKFRLDSDVVKKIDFGSTSSISSKSTINVHLRIKPISESKDIDGNHFIVEDEKTLITYLSGQAGVQRGKLQSFRYTFTNIFKPKASQSEVFEKVAYNCCEQLLHGQNCLLFSYGTTSSGKTYTIQGTGTHPGIIPRVLVTLFKSIKERQDVDGSLLYPDRVHTLTSLDDQSLFHLRNAKSKIMSFVHDSKCQNSTKSFKTTASSETGFQDESLGEMTYQEMKGRLENDIKEVKLRYGDVTYSVWVSFAEIYNENIYDLLDPATANRKTLRLAYDSDKSIYIKGLKYVNVESGCEAYKVFTYGKRNLNISSTLLNTSSSRSHSIFTIRLVRKHHDEEDAIYVSSFSICDLAGAERQKKAQNIGCRLKESQNINMSHLVLNRCFKIIRENQCRSEKQLVPYRDSKLTQLFQRGLTGKERVTMIVNINQNIDLLDETQQVLKASALAHDIVTQKRVVLSPVRKPSRFSTYIARRTLTVPPFKSQDSTALESICSDLKSAQEVDKQQVESLIKIIDGLKLQVNQEQDRNLQNEMVLRSELKAEFQKIVDETIEFYSKQLEEAKRKNEDLIGKLLEDEGVGGSRRKRKHPTSKATLDDSTLEYMKEEMRKEVDFLRGETERQRETISELTTEAKALRLRLSSLQIKNNLALQKKEHYLQLTKALTDGDLEAALRKLQEENTTQENKILELDEMVQVAHEEFVELNEKIDSLTKEDERKENLLLEKEMEIKQLKQDLQDVQAILDEKRNRDELWDEEIGKADDSAEVKTLKHKLQMAELKYKVAISESHQYKKLISELEEGDTKFALKSLEMINSIQEKKILESDEMLQVAHEEFQRYNAEIADYKSQLEQKNALLLEKVMETETLEGQIEDLRYIIDSRLDENKESGFLQSANQKEQEEERRRLEERCEVLNREKEETARELSSLKQRYSNLSQDLAHFKTTFAKMETDNKELIERVERKGNELVEKNERLAASEAEMKIFQQALKNEISLNTKLKSDLDTRNTEVTVLERKLKEAINASVAVDNNLRLENERLKETINTLEAAISDNLLEKQATETEIKLLLKDKENLLKQISEIESKLKESEKECDLMKESKKESDLMKESKKESELMKESKKGSNLSPLTRNLRKRIPKTEPKARNAISSYTESDEDSDVFLMPSTSKTTEKKKRRPKNKTVVEIPSHSYDAPKEEGGNSTRKSRRKLFTQNQEEVFEEVGDITTSQSSPASFIRVTRNTAK